METQEILKRIRQLHEESNVGLLFCYKALKKYNYDYHKALIYVTSTEFKNSIHILAKDKK